MEETQLVVTEKLDFENQTFSEPIASLENFELSDNDTKITGKVFPLTLL